MSMMSFRKVNIILALSTIVVFSSCDPDEEDLRGGVDLAFHSSYGNSYLVMDDSYSYGEHDIIFSELNFIFSELKLITEEGDEVALQSTGLIDFSDLSTIEAATEGVVLDFSDIPSGTYSAIQFDLGLGESYQGTSPGDYSSSDVLGNALHYWPGWQNYIITRLEARFDTNDDGLFIDESFQYHLGGDEAFRTVVLNKDFQILPGGETEIALNIDWRKVLFLDNDQIDPAEHSNTHTTDKAWLILELLDNMQQEITLE